ncbi:MAG: hypothetical protein JNL57_13280 [Bacteroidetes bacterium]|nr:hypothetical protein [Bacteroidota bacterium]
MRAKLGAGKQGNKKSRLVATIDGIFTGSNNILMFAPGSNITGLTDPVTRDNPPEMRS